MYLSGPVSYYKYIINNEEYHLFGDDHRKTKDCPFDDISTFDEKGQLVTINPNHIDIGYLLLDLKNKLEFYGDADLDIFIETQFRITNTSENPKYDTQNIVYVARYIFDDYLAHKYPIGHNIRAHYIDLRLLDETPNHWRVNVCHHILVNILGLSKENNVQEKMGKIIRLIKEIWYGRDLYYRELYNVMVGYYEDVYESTSLPTAMRKKIQLLWKDGIHKIRKQLDKLENKTINGYFLSHKISSYVFDLYENLQLSARVEQLLALKGQEQYDYLYEMGSYFLRAASLMMDAYTLARIFRNFSNNHNIKIVIAGYTHIEMYDVFFRELGCIPSVSIHRDVEDENIVSNSCLFIEDKNLY